MDNENENKIFFGKILGEIYRMQQSSKDMSCPSDAHIYALLNGFEDAINQELMYVGKISSTEVKSVMDVLDPIWKDQEKLNNFKGYYDIEHELEAKGVDRSAAIRILKYLKANGQFTEVIARMDTTYSPTECRTFELTNWDI